MYMLLFLWRGYLFWSKLKKLDHFGDAFIFTISKYSEVDLPFILFLLCFYACGLGIVIVITHNLVSHNSIFPQFANLFINVFFSFLHWQTFLYMQFIMLIDSYWSRVNFIDTPLRFALGSIDYIPTNNCRPKTWWNMPKVTYIDNSSYLIINYIMKSSSMLILFFLFYFFICLLFFGQKTKLITFEISFTSKCIWRNLNFVKCTLEFLPHSTLS